MKKEFNFEPSRLEEILDEMFGNGALAAVAGITLLLLLVNVFI